MNAPLALVGAPPNDPMCGISASEADQALATNEDGDGVLLAYLLKGQFCYDCSEDRWYEWAGNYWVHDLTGNRHKAVQLLIDVYVYRMGWLAAEDREAARSDNPGNDNKQKIEYFRKRIFALHTLKRQNIILKIAASGIGSLGISGEEWDNTKNLLPCKNGVISLYDGQLLPGQPEYFHRNFVPTEYQGIDAPAPRFEKFLMEIFAGDIEIIEFVIKLFGYALLGNSNEHIFPIAWGHGRNGKSTFLELIGYVLGKQLAGSVDCELLLQQRFNSGAGAPSPEICDLRGKRILWTSEAGENRRLNAAQIKKLVGGDELIGRRPHAPEMIRFKPTHVLMMLTNHMPSVSADDIAMWDRMRLIPFTQRFVDDPTAENEHPKEENLSETLRAESSGILAALIHGCQLYQRNGILPPQTVKMATTEYRSSEDEIADFIDAVCVIGENETVPAGDFFVAYKDWAEAQGTKSISSRTFGERMKLRFDRKRAKSGNIYIGIALKGMTIADKLANKMV